MFGIFDTKMLDVDTRGENGTLVIGMSFIFIAYFLHPAVESAYHRVRAYRAWRALEKRQSVEVTNYPMLAETLRGRGKWDTARIVTVLLAVFSLVSWGLELSMGLAYHEGEADLFNRSPSVTIETVGNESVWEVKRADDFVYDGNLEKDLNMRKDRALSMYNVVEAETCHSGRVMGSISVAFWSEDLNDKKADELYYQPSTNANVTVKNLQCAEGDNASKGIRLRDDNDNWGTVVTCENGPQQSNSTQGGNDADAPSNSTQGGNDADAPSNSTQGGNDADAPSNSTQGGNDADAPPMLILNRSSDAKTFLIVEERSNYPSFLYSVWTNGIQNNGSVELNHVFHIASTVRLAEAVVTTIVQDNETGFDCFSLVRVNSDNQDESESEDERDSDDESDSDSNRAKPFGEDPKDAPVEIQDLETIECGLQIDLKALICLVFLTLLTTVGITWSFCLRSSIGMDVYDRDELIRAVSMSVAAKASTAPSAIRIFVRKEDNGNLSVVISETGDAETGCTQFFRRGGQVVEDPEPAPVAASVAQFNDDSVRHTTRSVELTASPVPSASCSLVGTPVHSRSPLAPVPRVGPGVTGGRGASVLFEESFSSSYSGEDEPDGVQAGRSGEIESGGAPGARIVVPGDQRGVMPQGVTPPDIKRPRVLDRRAIMPRFSSKRLMAEANGGSSPVPPFMRNLTRDPPQLGPLTQGGGDEAKE